jgi:hypothetical protein
MAPRRQAQPRPVRIITAGPLAATVATPRVIEPDNWRADVAARLFCLLRRRCQVDCVHTRRTHHVATGLMALRQQIAPEIVMRSAGNFHPEWGYLFPANSFMHSLRIALVSIAIGATSGAVVVISLVERPGPTDENRPLAAHALVAEVPIVTAPGGAASLANTAAAARLPSSALITTPRSTPTAVASTEERSGTALLATAAASDDSAGSVETPSNVEAAPASPAPSAKVAVTKKASARRRHWQLATNGRNYRYYDRQFGPSFQSPGNRPFAQLGFGGPRNEW